MEFLSCFYITVCANQVWCKLGSRGVFISNVPYYGWYGCLYQTYRTTYNTVMTANTKCTELCTILLYSTYHIILCTTLFFPLRCSLYKAYNIMNYFLWYTKIRLDLYFSCCFARTYARLEQFIRPNRNTHQYQNGCLLCYLVIYNILRIFHSSKIWCMWNPCKALRWARSIKKINAFNKTLTKWLDITKMIIPSSKR